MKRFLHVSVFSLALTVPVPPSEAQSQHQDTTRIVVPAIATITTRTVIALASDTARAGSVSARAVADSLGFTLITRMPPLDQVADQRHAAFYYVPTSLKAGYVIIVPGRRPDVVWSLVPADSLRTRIRAYLILNRDLAPGSD